MFRENNEKLVDYITNVEKDQIRVKALNVLIKIVGRSDSKKMTDTIGIRAISLSYFAILYAK